MNILHGKEILLIHWFLNVILYGLISLGKITGKEINVILFFLSCLYVEKFLMKFVEVRKYVSTSDVNTEIRQRLADTPDF